MCGNNGAPRVPAHSTRKIPVHEPENCLEGSCTREVLGKLERRQLRFALYDEVHRPSLESILWARVSVRTVDRSANTGAASTNILEGIKVVRERCS